MKKEISIQRKGNQNQTPQPETPPSSNGIALASNLVCETDPFKLEVSKRGYKIISENEFGINVRKSQGKPSFLARTANGYLEKEKPNSLLLPESINTAMKVHIASLNINAQQYLTQLVMKDLRDNNLI